MMSNVVAVYLFIFNLTRTEGLMLWNVYNVPNSSLSKVPLSKMAKGLQCDKCDKTVFVPILIHVFAYFNAI